MTDEQKEDEIVESEISARDKKQIQDGACVNCALLSFIFTVISIFALVL
ncbi:MAG: hypothetical protein ACTSV2_11760 [Candidatus Thorarchaeota archaeon]